MWPYDVNGQNNQFIQNLMTQSMNQQQAIHTVKVNGRNGAEAFALAPNSDTLLLDTSDAIIWFVQTDGAGYKTITPYDITPHKEIKEEDKFKSLEDRISKLEETINNGKSNITTTVRNTKQQHNDASGRSDA